MLMPEHPIAVQLIGHLRFEYLHLQTVPRPRNRGDCGAICTLSREQKMSDRRHLFLQEGIKCAQRGGVGVVAYLRKEVGRCGHI
jgi:hypothetical protein